MALALTPVFIDFFSRVAAGELEIYNEFSLQHEFGIFLRSVLLGYRVEFERPVGFYGLQRTSFCKKEIDIVVSSRDSSTKVVIEFKFPRNGQYPEQMFKACQDIEFLEQLVRAGFQAGFFVVAVEDPLFYGGAERNGIYSYFRGSVPISGTILKPTGAKDLSTSICGPYTLKWKEAGSIQYAVVEVTANSAGVAISPPLTMKRL
jgi:hypothetical protein